MLRFINLLFIFLISVPVSGQNEKLIAEIHSAAGNPDFKNAVLGVCVVNVSTGAVVVEKNADVSLIPASTLKVLTTAAALEEFGPGHRISTYLAYTGSFDSLSGILNGDLVIIGGGDPTLGSDLFQDTIAVLDEWKLAVKKKGIKKINGSVIGDASCFEDDLIPSAWIWGDMGNYYGAGASGLTFRENKFTILFNSGASGTDTKIAAVKPEVPGLKMTNFVTSGGGKDNAYIFGSPYQFERFVKGTIPAGQKNYEVDGSIPDPALFCAQTLEKKLKENGIIIAGDASTNRLTSLSGKKKIIFHEHRSPEMSKIVYFTNLKSHNLFAEHLLKLLSLKVDKTGSTTGGTSYLKSFWEKKGIDIKGMSLYDGSGLSRANVITARQQANVLKWIASRSWKDDFMISLPVAGRSGSLAGICRGTCAENNLTAKSGYINRARGYAGFVKNTKGELLCFSVIANNYTCTPSVAKKILEKIMVKIAEL